MNNSVVLTLLAVSLTACGDPSAPVGVTGRLAARANTPGGEGAEATAAAHIDLRVERQSLLAADAALSSTTQQLGPAAGLAPAFTDAVRFLPLFAPILEGRAAAAAFLSTPLAPIARCWDALRADVSSDGTTGYTYGTTEFTLIRERAPTDALGHYRAFWRKDGGDWHVEALVVNAPRISPETPLLPAEFQTPTTKHRRYFPATDVSEQRESLLAIDAAFSSASIALGSGPAFAAYSAPDGASISTVRRKPARRTWG